MYNRDIKMYKLDLESGADITKSDIQTIINDHRSGIVPTMNKLEDYANGYNTEIKEKENKRESNVPNNTKSYSYGKRIVDTTTNYLIANNAKYFAQDKEYLESIENVQLINDDARESKEVIYNLVRFGIAGKLFYNEQDVDGQVVTKYASVDSREFIPIYNYDINPKLIAVIRYYTTQNARSEDDKTYITIYNENNEQRYEGGTNECQLVDTIPHQFKQVPFAVYGGGDYSGMLYHVLDQIDAYDLLQNGNLNEVEKHGLALLVFSDGATMTPEELKNAFEGGAIAVPTGMSAKEAIAYLTKDMNAVFQQYVCDTAKQEIFDLSSVPDFMNKDFAAQSGVALRFKLIGFDNSSRQIEEFFKSGESRAVDLITVSFDSSWLSRSQYYRTNPKRIIKIALIPNIPTDTQIQLLNAAQLKALGVETEVWVNALPADLIGNDRKAVIEGINAQEGKEIDEDFIQLQDDKNETEEVE